MAGKTGGIRAGRAFVEFYGKGGPLLKTMAKLRGRLRKWGRGVQSVGTKVAAAGAAIVAPLLLSAKVFAAAGDKLDKMAKRTGVSVEALSELGFAAEQSGADIDTLEKGVAKMQKTISDAQRGLTTATDALADLNLTAADLEGLTPEEQFKTIAEELSKIENPSKKAALAMELFGRGGQKLIPLLSEGREGMEALQKQARALGITMSTEDAAAAAELTDKWNILRRVGKRFVETVGAALAPTLIEAAESMTNMVTSAIHWIKENKALIVTTLKIAVAVTVAGAAIVAIGVAIVGASMVVGALMTLVSAFGAVIAAIVSPIGLGVAAIIGLGVALKNTRDAGVSAMQELAAGFATLKADAMEAIDGISAALASGDIRLAARILWLTIVTEFKRGKLAVTKIWSAFKTDVTAVAIDAMAGIEAVFIEGMAAVKSVWTSAAASFGSVWEDTINGVAKLMLRFQGLFDDSLDVEAALKGADNQSANNQKKIQEEKAADLGRIEKERTDALAKVVAGANALDKANTERGAEEIAGAEAELAKTIDEWKAAIEKARQQRDAAQGVDAKGNDKKPYEPIGVGGRVGFARGTFNGKAIQGLAAGGNQVAINRVAKATEETAEGVKRIARHAGKPRLQVV